MARRRRYFALLSAATRLVRRDTLRLPVFLWTTPFDTARMVSDSAALRAVSACLGSPEAMASSTARQEVRMRERRALFTAVRRAMTRVAFFADFVFAMIQTGLCDAEAAGYSAGRRLRQMLAVLKFGRPLCNEGGHALLLIFSRKQGVKQTPFEL